MKQRTRNLTDDEIALAKAMLSRGMKNDAVHFYFNRADRLISSGRIAQIRKGKYGASVEAAPASVLDTFLERWAAERQAASSSEDGSPTSTLKLRGLFHNEHGTSIVKTGETEKI
ncbi:hypothetical protein [Methylobacterium indicum]|uniref:Uncharacterized protein n=1 Tax=Methylobacterium indicum TaxID=1775910 RepID=A0A8H8WXM8_9HYPH|nr:hypothetical protein [Methylobacterium indicum]BCM86456.1 hypothetical protein mvi_49170 [Methylobacterium indicum]